MPLVQRTPVAVKTLIGGRLLHWRESGAGPALLFLHGFPLDGRMWAAQLNGLPPERRWLAPDLRGFGDTPLAASDELALSDLADDLVGLLDALEITDAVLCGLSMGGYVAFEFWRRHHVRARALVLCDTRAGADAPEARAARLESARRVRAEGTAAFVEEMLPRLLAPGTAREQPGLAERLRDVMRAAPAESVARAQEAMARRADSTELLSGIDVPCLVLGGAADALTPPAELERLAGAIPGARLALVPGAGHLPPVERPEAFNVELLRFLRGAVA